MDKRQVNFPILLNLLTGKSRFPVIGLVFVCLSIFVFIPLILILSTALKQPYQKYNFDEINKNGIEKDAKITSIKTVNNVTVNDEHPRIISYEYENNGQSVSDRFETLDLDKISNFNTATAIQILVYKGQSLIKDLTPFSFPVYLFFILPAIFLLIGIPFLLSGLIPALKIFNLYKTGIVKEAHVVSMTLNSSGLSIRGSQQNILVNYYFLDELGHKIFGKSTTNDFLILNEKKEGDIVKVFVSESDETQSCLIPKLEAVKNNWAV
jgi:hypothetical protein